MDNNQTISNNSELQNTQTAHPDPVRPSQTESDSVRPSTWLTLEQVEQQFAQAGLIRTRTLLARYCREKRLHGLKDAGPNGDEWYVDPVSVPRAIAELKRIGERRGGQTHPDPVRPSQTDPTPEQAKPQQNIEQAPVRPSQTESDSVRPGQPYVDITEHPLVKHLQKDADHWRDEYKNQVKVTQRVQQEAFDKMIELQRMVQVGQSNTLANFFLKAKQWALGEGELADNLTDEEPRTRTKKKKGNSEPTQDHDA